MMTEELSDVALLFAFGVLVLLILLFWASLAFGLAVLVGRMIRRRERQVPVEPVEPTREIPFYRMPPTDTVELPAFDPIQGQLGFPARTRR